MQFKLFKQLPNGGSEYRHEGNTVSFRCTSGMFEEEPYPETMEINLPEGHTFHVKKGADGAAASDAAKSREQAKAEREAAREQAKAERAKAREEATQAKAKARAEAAAERARLAAERAAAIAAAGVPNPPAPAA